MNLHPLQWIQKGSEIAGAGLSPVLSTSFAMGDGTAGALTQLGVVLVSEVTDYMQRQQSEREHTRSAAALVIALNKIQLRINAGEELRDDEFFRTRIGQPVSAQKVLDGVLTKAKLQYEERKALLMGNLLANASFDNTVSADDVSWMLSRIDSLTYRHLLVLAYFGANPNNGWDSNNIGQILNRSSIVAAQIEELRNAGLLSGHSTFAVPVDIIPAGQLLVKHADLLEELGYYGADIKKIIGSPS
jgi:hypothetical protein